MKVIPVAGHDSMLLNIGGAHNAYYHPQYCGTSPITPGIPALLVKRPGGEVIYQTLVDAIPMVLGCKLRT